MKKSAVTAILMALMLLIQADSFAQAKKGKVPPLTKDQAGEVKKLAADLYKSENFRGALDHYQRLVNYDPTNVDYNYRLGMCYLYTNYDKTQATQYFVKAADMKDVPKDVYYHMGRALLISGLFDEAIDAFDKYKSVNKGQVNSKYNVDQFAEYCYNAKEYIKNPVDVKFINPGKAVNSPKPDYAPVTMAVDTVLYFTSNRPGNMGGITDGYGDLVADVYTSSRVDTVWTKAKNAGISINSEYYDISSGLNSNGDKLLIYKENVEASGDIYISKLKGKNWQKAELLDEVFETKQFETGACMSPDGNRVYFAADMKGTLGGTDIFMMEKDSSKKWKVPVNLGPTVNTKFNEDFPFIWHDGKTLFFSSQGHNSMGGFDIFMTTQPDPAQDWSKPINVGYPLNTFDDDLNLTLAANGKTGYVTSLKPRGLGDLDIWYFRLKEPLVKNAGVLFRASILNAQGLPSKDAVCSIVKESTGQVISVMEANGAAAEIFVLLEAGTYKLKARSPKMGNLEEDIVIVGNEGEKGVRKTFRLKPIPGEK